MQPDTLIRELQQKNPQAFERIYELYSESTFGIIYSIVRNESVSEEIVQDVFLKIWEKAAFYDPKKGRFFTWVLNIARNAAIDKIRSKDFKNSNKNLSAQYFVDILEEKSNTASKTDAIGLQKYIDLLKPACKKIIDLLYFKGFTQQEASKELDIPLGTVKTRNRSCINSLRKIFT
ncbi:MAG TPA: RNA polymerase sigma factor [Flavobacteriaceae bacterium]|nr:RNA polymerase sigma factor [Flavobacteriaceae bacterium]